MTTSPIAAIRASCDHVAGAYAGAIFGELQHKPFDRGALTRFASGRGPVCDMGCGP